MARRVPSIGLIVETVAPIRSISTAIAGAADGVVG